MPGQELVWYGTTGQDSTTPGTSQPNRSRWLGSVRAAETLHEIQSTLTSTQDVRARHFIVDTARIGDGTQAHQLKWIAIQTGPSALAAARVMSFDDSTGVFKLDRPLIGSGVAATGDFYRIFDVNNVWPDVTAAQARVGEERFRAIMMRNETAGTINDVRIYFRVLDMGGDQFNRINTVNTFGGVFLDRANGSDQVDILDQLGQRDTTAGGGSGADGFIGSGGWTNPFGYGTADSESAIGILANNNMQVWLRRTIREGLRFRNSVAIQIIVETSDTGDDPDPLSSSAIMVYGVEGGTITGTQEPDRFLTRGGGVRIKGTVLSDGVPLADRPVLWQIEAGDLGAIFTDDDPLANYSTTDEDGVTFATLTAPDTDLSVGEVTHPQLLIGAGGEVGDP